MRRTDTVATRNILIPQVNGVLLLLLCQLTVSSPAFRTMPPGRLIRDNTAAEHDLAFLCVTKCFLRRKTVQDLLLIRRATVRAGYVWTAKSLEHVATQISFTGMAASSAQQTN